MKRRIVQIATSITALPDGGMCEALYVLTDDGTLWAWNIGSAGWHPFPPLPQPEAEETKE